MAFVVPTFNLTCDVYDGVTRLVRSSPICNKSFGRRVAAQAQNDTAIADNSNVMYILLPAGTDVRSYPQGGDPPINNDVIECPQGSGMFYDIVMVDDVATGFPNEYRVAVGVQFWQAWMPGAWPRPLP
jgi:hypothetical protein